MPDQPELTPHQIYVKYMEAVEKSKLSNSAAFDKAVLTLSSSGLGLSLTFFKLIIPAENAACLILLKSAWIAFLCAIVATMLSFRIAQWGYNTAIKYAEKFYLEGLDEYENKRNTPAQFSELLNWISALSFALALFLLVYFVMVNL